MEDRLNFIEQFFDFEDLYHRLDDIFTKNLYEDYEFTEKITEQFFDYNSFYKVLKENTLKKFAERDDFLDFLDHTTVTNIEWGNTLWDFITGEYGVEPDWEVSEESGGIDISGNHTYLSFFVDTGYSNEGGSHDGGYEYLFVVDLNNMILRELQIINWN